MFYFDFMAVFRAVWCFYYLVVGSGWIVLLLLIHFPKCLITLIYYKLFLYPIPKKNHTSLTRDIKHKVCRLNMAKAISLATVNWSLSHILKLWTQFAHLLSLGLPMNEAVMSFFAKKFFLKPAEAAGGCMLPLWASESPWEWPLVAFAGLRLYQP